MMKLAFHRHLFFSALTLTGLLATTSSQALAQTLSETIQLARDYQSERRLAGLQINDQVAQLAQIRAQYGTKLTGSVEFGAGYIDTEQGALFPEQGKRFPQTYALQFSYPLYTGGRKQLALDAANTAIEAAKANLEYVDNQTVLAAISLHAAISRDLALIQLEKDSQRALDQAAHDAALRLKAGEVTKTDLAQANARQSQGIASQSRAAANLQIDQSRYLQLTGQAAGPLQTLSVPQIPDTNTAAQLLEQTPALQNARLQLKAAQQQVELSQHSNYPSLQLAAHANNQKDSDFSREKIGAYGVSLQASMPLLDGGVRKADVARAQSKVAMAQEQLDNLRHQLQQNLTQNYATLQASQSEYTALVSARDAAQLALQTIQRELQLGTRTTYDLLTAERDLLDANTQIVLNQEQQSLSAYQILANLNQL